MSELVKQYNVLLDDLHSLRGKYSNEDDIPEDEENDILDKLDVIWYKMSVDEIREVDPPWGGLNDQKS